MISGYLKLDENRKLVWSPATTDGDVTYTITGATHFTGLLDTPEDYEHGKYLRVHDTDQTIEYIDITGLAEEVAQEIDFPEGVTGFTGLHDTPSNYESGYYLRSTEVGIEYIDITGLAEEVAQEIDFPEGVTGFTGLHDTPSNYELGKYLRSSAEGVTYAGLIPETYNSIEEAPTPPSDYDGEIVRVGCDIMISCDGEWKPLVSTDRLPLSEEERVFYPGCVTTVGDSIIYTEYIDEVLNNNSALILEARLNGQTVDDVLHEVCTFQNIDGQSNNTSSEGTWQNITTNYNFASCPITFSNGTLRHWDTWSTRTSNGNSCPGASCEFSRDSKILAVGWAPHSSEPDMYIDMLSVVFSNGVLQNSPAPIASLRSNVATSYWGRSFSMNDDATVIAVSDVGLTNTNGGTGAVVVFERNASNNTITEKQLIRLPLTSSDCNIDDSVTIDGTTYPAGGHGYNGLQFRLMSVQVSGDGKTIAISFLQNYFDPNPKALFIYNYNDSTQTWDLIQTINGIGFQDMRMSKDGSTIAVKCGFHYSGNGSDLGVAEAFGYFATDGKGNIPVPGLSDSYFHGIKVFRRDSQNIWTNTDNLSIFDLGIQEAVQTEGIDWNKKIVWHLGNIFEINRDGTAINFQFPDRLSLRSYTGPSTNSLGQQLSFESIYLPTQVAQNHSDEYSGPAAVITWDGENWNRLGDFIFDKGTFGFSLQNVRRRSSYGLSNKRNGAISEDGTLFMASSRIFYDSDYYINANFLKWTGSSWEKLSKEWFRSRSNFDSHTEGGYTMSMTKHPDANTIVGFHGYKNQSSSASSKGFYFTEECSTNLVGGGTTSTNSPVYSCGVVRIKDTGYKWGLFPDNTQITVQAFPSSNCTFEGWTGGNFVDPSSLETTVTITDSTSITGNFSVI